MSLETIEKHAQAARAWAEENAPHYQRQWGLCGMCARASANLASRLHQDGIECYIVLGRVPFGGHVFLVAEEHVIDVTATQFDGYGEYAPVEIVPLTDAIHQVPWDGTVRTFAKPEDLQAWQQDDGWPEDQVVADEDYLTLWA